MSEFDKIVGYSEVKAELMRYVDVLKNPEKYDKLGVTLPRGILIWGDPGLGKTLMANAFIKEVGCEVFTLRKMKPDGDFINQIKETFEAAKKEKLAIVFLDDMDKFANEDVDHKDAEEYVTVQSCIDDCRGFRVLVLATINEKYLLPDSLLRAGRFDKTIELELPKGQDAREIIQYYLQRKALVENIDYEETYRLMEGHSCAEIESVINEAGIYAGYDGRDRIGQGDIVKASLRIFFNSPECSDIKDKEIVRKIAIHEAGHALVSELQYPGSVVFTSVWGASSTAGATKYYFPEGFKLTNDYIIMDVINTLAGKAATEVIDGVPDMGCQNDVDHAYHMLARYNCDLCGCNFETRTECSSSGYMFENKDRYLVFELQKLYMNAKRLLIENRNFLEDIVESLIKRKTLLCKDIQMIKCKVDYERNRQNA